jgi:TolB-like protein/class 3 adenylate cyclase/Tfp pilus assembly protein PilF
MNVEQQDKRRLAAIMFTDIAGYSALAQRDEALCLELLGEHRKILRPLFQQFAGREIEAIGDAFLVEFESALGAAKCAIEIQKQLRGRNMASPVERAIRLRIGLHLGDVVHMGDRVHGDGVNIAARIQPLADPGGICLSEDFVRQVRNKLDLPLLNLGKPNLKNIRSPICVFKLLLPWEQQRLPLVERIRFLSRQQRVRILGMAILMLVMIGVGLYLWFNDRLKGQAPARNRIAVMPFVNINQDPQDEYFADGMTEELISELSGIRGLDVIARTSVMKYKGSTTDIAEIGRALGIEAVLEGSVRTAMDKTRISVKLIDVSTQSSLWTKEYDRELRDIFAIQSDIARMVAQELAIQLVASENEQLGKGGTGNLEAHRSFLVGRFHLNKRTATDIGKAIGFFHDAINADPEYAEAYTGLAECYTLVAAAGYDILPRTEATAQARQAVMKALEIDETLAEAHTALAYVRFRLDLDWPGAEREFKRAIELKPGNARSHEWYALFLSALGRHQEAIAEIRRASQLDPLSSSVSTGVGRILELARRYDESVTQLRKAIAMDSTYADAHFILGMVLTHMGNYPEAISELKVAYRLSGERPVIYSFLGLTYAAAGKTAEAEKIFEDIVQMWTEKKVPVYHLALVHIGRKQYAEALERLEEALTEHEGLLIYLKSDPMVDPLRKQQGFQEFLRKIWPDRYF